MNDFKVLWIYLLPIFAFFLLGKREGVVWSIFSILMISYFLWGRNNYMYNYWPYVNKVRYLTTYILICVTSYITENSRHIFHMGMILESEKLKEEKKKLAEAVDVANNASAAKSQFLANISHELRTPLNGIMGISSLLEDTHLTAEQHEYLDVLNSSSNSLLGIINDILDIESFKSGKEHVESEKFNLYSLIDNLVNDFLPKALDKNLELTTNIDPRLPVYYLGDSVKITQVLSSLVSNAIKFTDSGFIVIKVSLKKQDTHEISIKFSVVDSGIGVDLNKTEMIFSSFSQIDGSMTRKHGGSGLGLAIASEIASILDSSIFVKNNKSGGATFGIILTLKKDNQANISPLSEISSNVIPLNCLVLDPVKQSLNALLQYLSFSGIQYEGFSSFSDLSDELSVSNKEYDIIFVDEKLSVPKNISLFSFLDNINTRHKAKIIILRYRNSQSNDDGLYKCLYKPFSPIELKNIILGINVQISGGSSLGSNSFDIQENVVEVLLVEDNTVNLKLEKNLLNKLNCNVTTAENGLLAIEQLRTRKFDIIFMDIQMPEMDGIEATKIIRSNKYPEIDSKIPIVAVTAHATKSDSDKCFEVGMDSYISKPVKLQSFVKALHDHSF